MIFTCRLLQSSETPNIVLRSNCHNIQDCRGRGGNRTSRHEFFNPRERIHQFILHGRRGRIKYTIYSNKHVTVIIIQFNSIQFFIIYVPSQQLQGQLQTQHSVDTTIIIIESNNVLTIMINNNNNNNIIIIIIILWCYYY
jgi:hypothetical protein